MANKQNALNKSKKNTSILHSLLALLDVVRIIVLIYFGAGFGIVSANRLTGTANENESIGRALILFFFFLVFTAGQFFKGKAVEYVRMDSPKPSFYSWFLIGWGNIITSYPVFYKYGIESIMIFGFTYLGFIIAILASKAG